MFIKFCFVKDFVKFHSSKIFISGASQSILDNDVLGATFSKTTLVK